MLNVIRGYDCQFESSLKGPLNFFSLFSSPFILSFFFFWTAEAVSKLSLSSLSNDVTFFERRYKKGDKTKTNKQKDCT